MVDRNDVHELMKEFVLLKGSRTLRSGRFSFKNCLCMMQQHGFCNVSGYLFLILKFPVVPPDAKKCGVKKKFLLASLAGCTPTFKNVAPPLLQLCRGMIWVC